MKEQTPIEWLVDELKKNDFLGFYCDISQEEDRRKLMNKIIDEAKDIESVEMYNQYLLGYGDGIDYND